MGNKVEPVRQEGDKKNSKNTKDDDIVAEVDDDLENGPVFKRKCTDIICCPIFVAFIVGMAWAFIYGLSEGDPIKLTVMFDYDGHGCGYTSGYKNFDYIYWPDIDTSATSFSTLLQKTICVKRCPTIANPLASGDCTDTSIASPCESSGTAYDSKLYLNRFCVPDTSSTSATSTYQSFYDSVMDDWGGNYLTSYMADLYTVWWVCLVCAGLSFLLGFIYMCFIKCCAKILVWITIFLGFFIILGAGLFLYFTSTQYEEGDDTRNYMRYTAYGFFGLCAVYALILLCCCNKIRLGVAIMQTTADYINSTTRIFWVPVFFFVCILCFLAYWIVSALFIWSVGDVKARSSSPFARIEWNETTRYVFLYNLFGLFWINAFFIGCSQFILAVACATWYFTNTADSGGSASINKGFKWILRYHLGSIAFGSLIIAICEFIKFMFEYYRKKMTGRVFNNPLGKCLIWTTRYCLNCLNRVVKYISKMAYIQIALTSSNFCMSAWKAFILILGNAGRFAVATILGTIFTWLGKIAIVGLTTLICYIIITNASNIKDDITSPFFPILAFIIISYVISSFFLSIFSFSMDVILQCFLVDETLAKDSQYGPHRPKTLDAYAQKKMQPSKCCGCC